MPIFKRRLNLHLFVHLAFDPGAVGLLVPGEERLVLIVHVAADADRALGDKALFAGFLPADVMEDAIAAGEEGVGDDLLVGRIGLRRGAGEEVVVPAREDGIEVALRLEVQPVETAELVEETSPNDEHVFVRRAHFSSAAL